MSEYQENIGQDPEFESCTRRLLVSVPDLADDNFDRTVIYMVEHDEHGAVGLVLNRPSETAVHEHLPMIADEVLSPSVFFVGGPVAIGSLMALGRRRIDADAPRAVSLDGPLVMVDPEALLENHLDGLEALRLFTGYSGWAPGQLDAELNSGVWHVVEAMTDDVLCADPEGLWRAVMRRQGGKLASQALYPEDLSTN